MPHPDDRSILQACLRQEPAAQRQLYRREAAVVYDLVYRMDVKLSYGDMDMIPDLEQTYYRQVDVDWE